MGLARTTLAYRGLARGRDAGSGTADLAAASMSWHVEAIRLAHALANDVSSLNPRDFDGMVALVQLQGSSLTAAAAATVGDILQEDPAGTSDALARRAWLRVVSAAMAAASAVLRAPADATGPMQDYGAAMSALIAAGVALERQWATVQADSGRVH